MCFPESIAKGSSVRSPLEKYIGSSTQGTMQAESSEQSIVHRVKYIRVKYISEVHRVKCIVHRVKYIRVKYIE